MTGWWTELWSLGAGQSRINCGVARTQEGFAVEIFCGGRRIESEVHLTRDTAVRAAMAKERRYHGELMQLRDKEV